MTGITRKVKEKVKDAKDKVVGPTEKATNTTKKSVSSTTDNQAMDNKCRIQVYD